MLEPGWHTLPSQQPVGHVCALQLELTHERPSHVAPAAQLVHCAPLAPHAVALEPGWHTLPWQQPLGHVCALHVVVWQEPALQNWPTAHALHATPPVPHVGLACSRRQKPSWQQPSAQVLALQATGVVHTLLLHRCAPAQTSHVRPPEPHAVFSSPSTHTPALQHPFGHVSALHEPPVHWPELHV